MDNPYTEEVVDVVHVANDPFNYTISEWLILAPEDFKTGEKAEPERSLLFSHGRDLVTSLRSVQICTYTIQTHYNQINGSGNHRVKWHAF
ncbi:MAG: hypothetical protein Ct9H90mP13_13170 [Pseudomonadota bacterium]|nr:MAG: hypothetical protein Ct9H90mP13_13170 [Pseudomonadota bacterium]